MPTADRADRDPLPTPLGLLAELTHRCPLGCLYCSNPLELERREDELDSASWTRVFQEAAALGVLQLHLSGGEPAVRQDLCAITGAARAAGLYTNLITSGIGLSKQRLAELVAIGLDHIQVSFQDCDADLADKVADYRGASARKHAIAAEAVRLGLPLTINAVLHRGNIARMGSLVAMAVALGATRIELAHVQYHGWALRNRAALMPRRDEVLRAAAAIEELRARFYGTIVIDAVMPDYFARYPKACLGGWGRRSLNVTPSGLVLPCHAAQTLPGLEFWSVRNHPLAEIWSDCPAFNLFRGFGWMDNPCSDCPRKAQDFGGCRCQAFALTGNPAATDPVCHLSPAHGLVTDLADGEEPQPLAFRGRTTASAANAHSIQT